MPDALAELSAAGVSIWLDDLSRERLVSGSLQRLVRDRHVVGVTTNPSIFAASISASGSYDAQLADLARAGTDVREALRLLTAYDVRWAADVLRGVHEATAGRDGYVSIEVDPLSALDRATTVAEARRLWWLVDRPNVLIKIPATDECLPAIADCLAEGISVNVTLIFSVDRYAQVAQAHLAGLERAAAAGRDLSSISSVASFFVSRVDTEVDRRLTGIGGALALRGEAALANARLAFARHEEVIGSVRWSRLAAAGATPQRLLWASTGVKNPHYEDTRYVLDLVTDGVVSTMPEKTLDAVADHGCIRGDTVRGTYQDAREVLTGLGRAGIDAAEVAQVLEQQGADTFQAAWEGLTDKLAERMRAMSTTPTHRAPVPVPRATEAVA